MARLALGLFAALALALPAAAGTASDQLCRAAGRSAGCADATYPSDSYRPPRDRDDDGRAVPRGCPECRAETIRRLGRMRPLQPPAWSGADQRREHLQSIWHDERRRAASLGPLLAAKPSVKSPHPAPKKPKPPLSPIEIIREKISKGAEAARDSVLWAFEAARSPFKPNTNKCNLFVVEMARDGGAVVPNIRGYRKTNPPTAGDWADTSVTIPGWIIVDKPKPGDIIAMPLANPSRGATGHCGIVVGERKTASAGGKVVLVNDWGFRKGDVPTFRRYVGE